MAPSTPAEDGEGPAAWAAVYRDENEPDERRQEALERLISGYRDELESGTPSPPVGCGDTLVRLLAPEIRRVAGMCAHGATAGERDDFLDDAVTDLCKPRPGRVPAICLYEPTAGPLAPWLHKALSRRWIDRCRRRRFLLPLDAACLLPDESSAVSLGGASLLFGEPFPRADLLALAQWPTRERILLLCLTGLFVKLGQCSEQQALWEGWLVEYEGERGITLPRPFPSAQVENLESHNERKGPLSQELQMTTQALDVYLHRQKKRLRHLECIQDAR